MQYNKQYSIVVQKIHSGLAYFLSIRGEFHAKTESEFSMLQQPGTTYCSVALLFALLLLAACSPRERKPFFEADISDIPADTLRISRYEEMLFSLDPMKLRQEIAPHVEEFYFFLEEEVDDPSSLQLLYNYITDPFLIGLYEDTREAWPRLDDLSATLGKAFRFYRHHFPEQETPRVYTYVSGLDYQMPVLLAENHLVIGLDNYLGAGYPVYGQIGIPRYMAHWMQPAKVAVDVAAVLAERHLAQAGFRPETLLDHMIHQGKKLYFIDCLLPRTADTTKISYTGGQMEWMQRNQGRVWAYKLDNELLYSGDHAAIQNFITQAPFTSAFSRHSAPRTGSWLGWQIVREYMRRNPEVSLQELLHETDSGKLLHQARFRPG